MSNLMNVEDILNIEDDHYGAGKYILEVGKATAKEFNSGRTGINVQLKIVDTEVLKDGRVPRGETLFKTFFIPTTLDKKGTQDFLGRMVKEFFLATKISEHPDYPTISAQGIDSETLWNLAAGSQIQATVTWKEKKEKVTDEQTGQVTSVPTGDYEQGIERFKAIN